MTATVNDHRILPLLKKIHSEYQQKLRQSRDISMKTYMEFTCLSVTEDSKAHTQTATKGGCGEGLVKHLQGGNFREFFSPWAAVIRQSLTAKDFHARNKENTYICNYTICPKSFEPMKMKVLSHS